MPGLITTHKINHVTTMTKDTSVAMEFYNDLLGIKQIESQVDNPEITWLQLESGIMVHLIETQEAPAKPDRIHHAFEVEDFEGTRATLEQNGFEIEREGVRYDGQAFPVHPRSRRQPRRVLHLLGLRPGPAPTVELLGIV